MNMLVGVLNPIVFFNLVNHTVHWGLSSHSVVHRRLDERGPIWGREQAALPLSPPAATPSPRPTTPRYTYDIQSAQHSVHMCLCLLLEVTVL